MQVRVLDDRVEIEGYVNAVERKSKPLWSRIGQFVERICKGAFFRALERNDNVRWMLNHERDIGGIKDGNLQLKEDAIGLWFHGVSKDPEVIQRARDGRLVGCSFGFFDREVEQKRDEDGFPLRDVIDLDLEEVSILDDTTTPAYDGTLVSVRSDEKTVYYGEAFTDEIHIREEQPEAPEEVRAETEQTEEVPKQQETVEPDKRLDEFKKLVADMKH